MAVQNDVNTPSDVYNKQKDLWVIPRALMGGTREMRRHGEKLLPKDAAETPTDYSARLNRSTLFNAFRKTVKDMTGKVFQKAVMLEDDVPDQVKALAENVDLCGRHLNVFARDCFFDAMQLGIGYIVTDMPPSVRGPNGEVATLAAEQAAGIRPYLTYVRCEDLIGWQSQLVNGLEVLTQIRIREHPMVADGPFNEKAIDQVRVLSPGAWQTWRRGNTPETQSNWFLFEAGTSSITDTIPIAPIYINRTGFMTAEPPLEDLADLNVAHWQSQSDQRNLLHVARVPILFGAGFTADDKIVIGANSMIRNNSADAKLTYVEHTGAAINSGNMDLENLQFQMQTQGLQLLVPSPGQTATGEIRDDAKENSPLAMMANALGDALEMSLGFMAEFMKCAVVPANNKGGKGGGSVAVNTDFGVSIGAADLQLLLNAVNGGKLSEETFWSELQRRDVLSSSFDPEVEADRLASAAPTFTAPSPMNLAGSNQPGVTANGDPADDGAVDE